MSNTDTNLDAEFQKIREPLLKGFAERAKGQGWRPGTVTYTKAFLNYMVGANVAFNAAHGDEGAWPILLLVSVGRSAEELM